MPPVARWRPLTGLAMPNSAPVGATRLSGFRPKPPTRACLQPHVREMVAVKRCHHLSGAFAYGAPLPLGLRHPHSVGRRRHAPQSRFAGNITGRSVPEIWQTVGVGALPSITARRWQLAAGKNRVADIQALLPLFLNQDLHCGFCGSWHCRNSTIDGVST